MMKRIVILLLALALLPLSSVSVMAKTINFGFGYVDPQNPMDGSSCDIDTSFLKSGVYIIHAIIGDEVLIKKVVIK